MNELEAHHLQMANIVGGLTKQVEALSRMFDSHSEQEMDRYDQLLVELRGLRDGQTEHPDTHRQHHEALASFIEREKKRSAMIDKVMAEAGKSVTLALIGALLWIVWEGVKVAVRAKGIS